MKAGTLDDYTAVLEMGGRTPGKFAWTAWQQRECVCRCFGNAACNITTGRVPALLSPKHNDIYIHVTVPNEFPDDSPGGAPDRHVEMWPVSCAMTPGFFADCKKLRISSLAQEKKARMALVTEITEWAESNPSVSRKTEGSRSLLHGSALTFGVFANRAVAHSIRLSGSRSFRKGTATGATL